MKKGVLFFCTLFFLLLSLQADSPEEFLDRINQAVAGEFYNKAVSLIEDGKQLYPLDIRFPLAAGELYSSRKLYNLALDSYKDAEALDPEDRETQKEIVSVLGFLDRNEEALSYLEDLVEEEEDPYLIDDLGWLYFKTHQPEKGIPLLEAALDGDFRKSLALTLGTLYSEVNNQTLCRKYYQKAIESALKTGDSYFASVAYYNLALAEQSFYSYEKAIEYARLSLQQMDRSGGHLALGDLYLVNGEYEKAGREVRDAVPLDKTPLSSMNLASLYRMMGDLDRALGEADALRADKDDSWMYYYGIDRDQFDMDLNELYRDIYRGLYQTEKLTAPWGLKEWGKRLWRIARSLSLSYYYDAQYRILAFRLGKKQIERSSPLRGALTLASAASGFRAVAEEYLSRARIQEAGDPFSTPWYDLEEGKEAGDAALIIKGLEGFQKEWEARLIEECYQEILRQNLSGSGMSRNEAAVAVFRQNPGGLKQYGIRLPVFVQLTGRDADRMSSQISRYLRRQGLTAVSLFTGVEPVIRIHRVSDKLWDYSVTWPDGTGIAAGDCPPGESGRQTAYELSWRIAESLFP